MKSRSLSASFGSWCVQLIYNPRRAVSGRFGEPAHSPKTTQTSDFALLFPAFLASWITVGAGSYALSHFITLANFTSTLAVILFGSAFIALGAQCFAMPWRRLCEASRWPIVLVLVLLAISTRFSNVIPVDEASESNALVAVFLCFITLLSVLLAGAKSGGRIVPLSAPLVPGLSLFGLLCLISVDAEVQVCFLIFLAAAIYLLSYNRFLHRVRPDLTLGNSISSPKNASLPLRNEVFAWTRQSLLVAGAWFVVFLAGGGLFYMPVQRFLPVLMAPQLNRVRAAAQGVVLDYRGSSAVMELQGGNYTLSDREVLRVTMHQGEPSGLWRGRVYKHYERSRWDEGLSDHPLPWPSRYRPHPLDYIKQWSIKPPDLKPLEGSTREILEEVEALEDVPGVFYSSGTIVPPVVRAPRVTDGDAIFAPVDAIAGGTSYMVRSFLVEPNWGTLLSASGYEEEETVPSPELASTLELPDDPLLRMTLKLLKRQLYAETRRPPKSPFAKVRTISNYLIQNCAYSLNSPSVPAERDGVEFFLNDSRQGACDMFASSMVLLLRQMNVPARLVTGYLQPDDTPTASGAQPRTYVLRERDAHAWVEYYVPKYGWLSYDPTAGTRTSDNVMRSQITNWLSVSVPNVPAHIFLLPAIALGLVALGAAWGRPKVHVAVPKEADDEQLRRFIESRYLRAVSRLRRQVPHPAHLTPGEYEARVFRAVIPVDAKQEFAALTHLYIAARYGHLAPISRTQIDECLARFEHALKRKRTQNTRH